MVEITTKSGKTHKLMGFDWDVTVDGNLVIRSGDRKLKTVFASGAWESVREYGE